MNTRIESSSFTLSDANHEWIQAQLDRQLQRFKGEVVHVEVYISDLNAGRSGDDLRLVMRANLRGLPSVSVTTEHGDLYVAASRSAKRLRRAVKKTLKKNRRVEPRKVFALRRRSLEMASH